MEDDMDSKTLKLLIASIVAASLIAPSCAARTEGDDQALNISTSANRFGFDLYGVIAAESRGENIFISPLSISLALSMTYNGAAGRTATEMAGVLGVGGMELEEINDSNGRLMKELSGEIEDVRLDIANSLWARDGFTFKKPFLERTSRHYEAEIRSLDFRSPSAKEIINGWVAERTQGMIAELLDLIPADAILYLINAIYFKGAWSEEFDPEQTREEDFHISDDHTKKVPMMHRSDKFQYFDGEGFKAVSLPYGDGRISMHLFLPDKDSSLEEFHKSLDIESWKGWMSSYSKRSGSVALPRFKAEYRKILNGPLAGLGMASAFDQVSAEFSEMIETPAGNLYISRVIHQAVIVVNEEGTEAAAATAVEIKLTSVRIEEDPFVMVFDRPFFFAIRDNRTGSLIFMGSITDPR
jgi:serine protease inhibitor